MKKEHSDRHAQETSELRERDQLEEDEGELIVGGYGIKFKLRMDGCMDIPHRITSQH